LNLFLILLFVGYMVFTNISVFNKI
jgi:hypothetical protein